MEPHPGHPRLHPKKPLHHPPEPYLSAGPKHQGITLHAIYHRPNNWDYIPKGRKIPCGESAMWGDYHTMELVSLIKREAQNAPYPLFFQ